MPAYETSETSTQDRKLDAIAYEISAQNVRLAARKVMLRLKYDSNQPRVPAGNPAGGQWTDGCDETTARRLTAPLKNGGLSYNRTREIVSAHNHSGQSDDLVMAIAYRESRFDPKAKKPTSSAVGLMGLTRDAIKDLQERYDGYDDIDKFDAEQNIDAASRYLSLRVKWAHGDVRKALAGYGEGTAYADSILRAENLLKNAKNPLAVLQECFGK
jgi:soluble lytic murein transglycosylase-like protein